jgi:hypothetical protein
MRHLRAKKRSRRATAQQPQRESAEEFALARQAFEKMDAPRRRKEEELLRQIKAQLPQLQTLLLQVKGKEEDLVYRFYHQSFKVYAVQHCTQLIVDALQHLLPEVEMDKWFKQIVAEGTGREFALEDNERWLEVTRPMLEAFFHARYLLEQVCTYGAELDDPTNVLPSGWAAVLYLYGLR